MKNPILLYCENNGVVGVMRSDDQYRFVETASGYDSAAEALIREEIPVLSFYKQPLADWRGITNYAGSWNTFLAYVYEQDRRIQNAKALGRAMYVPFANGFRGQTRTAPPKPESLEEVLRDRYWQDSLLYPQDIWFDQLDLSPLLKVRRFSLERINRLAHQINF